MAKKKKVIPGDKIDKIRENLETSADILRESFHGLDAVKKNRKEISQKLKRIEKNVENYRRLIRRLKEKQKKKAAKAKARKCYPRKKAVVFFHKSDFYTPNEYITAMRKPMIKTSEVKKVDWDELGQRLARANA